MECLKCKKENLVPHITITRKKCGLIVICQDCWKSSTVDERVSYYRKLYEFWLEHCMIPLLTWNQLETLIRDDSKLSEKELIIKMLNFIKRKENLNEHRR